MAIATKKKAATGRPSIIEFCTDPALLGLELSAAQATLLKAIYGLDLTPTELTLWHACTGRFRYPGVPFSEITVLAGARSGKDSRIAIPTLLYEAIFGGHEAHLAKGERGVLPLVAQDQRATRIAFTYAKDYLMRSPLLRAKVDGEPLANELTLTNGMSVLCFPSTLKSLRGFSSPAGCLDELAFFRLEGQADSDAEIQASIRRGMLSFPSPKLIKISTPYLKSGVLFDDYTRAWATDDPDLLVWRASTAVMNPTITPERLARERRLDASRFSREYEATFADALTAFLTEAEVDAAVVRNRLELRPRHGVHYTAALDSSQTRSDEFCFALVHTEERPGGRITVQDVLRAWGAGPAATPLADIVREIAALLDAYRVRRCWGDRYLAEVLLQDLRRHHVAYEESKLDRTAAYLEVQPLFRAGTLELLDDPEMIRQFKLLEHRNLPQGRVRVDHPSSTRFHDDRANAVALAAAHAQVLRPSQPLRSFGKASVQDRLGADSVGLVVGIPGKSF